MNAVRTFGCRRSFSLSSIKPIPIDPHRIANVSFEELFGHLKWIKENSKTECGVVMIDVRGAQEIEEYGGSIPTAKNMSSTTA